MNIIDVSNVTFSYSDRVILENISFSVHQGEFIGIIGPNGGGKTTLLKLIMGLLTPSKGKVSLFNQLPQNTCDRIGYVPQNTKIDSDFPITVKEFILLGALSKASFWGKYPKPLLKKAEELLEMLGLHSLQKNRFGLLSGGQKQRVLIARALIKDPKLLILDEPTANIDTETEKIIFDFFSLFKDKKTILMVNHDLKVVVKKVSAVLFVRKTVQKCLPQEICEHFALGLYHEPLLKKEK